MKIKSKVTSLFLIFCLLLSMSTNIVVAQTELGSGDYTIEQTSSNADLDNITLSEGTLSPIFDSTTTSYTANVANEINSITVTPTVAEEMASIEVNGDEVISGDATAAIPLTVGINIIHVVVTAEDGSTKTYTVEVTKAGSSNADLSKIALSEGTLSPSFESGTTEYIANVGNEVSSITLTPTVVHSSTTVTVNGTPVINGSGADIPLIIGENEANVVVTAEDASVKIYTVTVTRAASSNADLSNIALSEGTLSPSFESETTEYIANVGNEVSSITLTPTLVDSSTTVTVNGTPVINGSGADIPLIIGENEANVVVTAEDGNVKIYTVTVTRAVSSNADLSNIALSEGTLSPNFESGTTSYTANVENEISSITVTPTVEDTTATVAVNGEVVKNGNASSDINLDIGKNTINVDVAAQDDSIKTYTIEVTRELLYTPEHYFTFDAATGTITNYSHSGPKDVIIPSTIGGVEVTDIGSHAFRSKSLTSVEIPDTVTSIGTWAFRANQLTTITIPDSVTSIGSSAFTNNLLSSFENITIPDRLLGESSYLFTSNKFTHLELPDGITNIGTGMFRYNKMESVVIPDSVTSIGSYAFSNNQLSSFEDITIPHRLLGESSYLFTNNKFTHLELPDGITNIGNGMFRYNEMESVVIPDSVTSIGHYAFGNNKLTSLIMPDSVTSIGSYAFANNQLSSFENITIPHRLLGESSYLFTNNKFTHLELPDGITNIGSGMFRYNEMESVVIPDSVTSIGHYAFNNNSLINLTIPDTVTSIGWDAFSNNQLTSVTLSKNLSSIGSRAFRGNQLTKINLPSSLRSLSYSVFADNQITSINIPGSVSSIGSYAFQNNQLTSVNIPASVSSIGSYAFQNNQLTNVTIANGPRYIYTGAFMNNQLETINIPNSVWHIGNSAYENNQLYNISIPDSVTNIGNLSFKNNDLGHVKILHKTASIGDEAFSNNRDDLIIYGYEDSTAKSYALSNDKSFKYLYNLTYTAGPYGTINGEKNQIIVHGENGTQVTASPNLGFHFVEWSDGLRWATRTDTNISKSINLIANFAINRYTVWFNDYNGRRLKTEEVTYGSSARPPSNPTREGYTFTGWSENFSYITRNLTVTAEYEINRYTVIFKDYDGTVLKTDVVTHGSDAISPTHPIREGYTFKGWDKTLNNITQDLTITAQYEINQYTVTFDSNGGSAVDAIIADFNTTIKAPNNPIKEGYNFRGWYKDSDFMTPWNFISDQVPAEDITLYAKWQIKEYTVTFKDFDGTALKTDVVTHGSNAKSPSNPTREGYTFTGWDKKLNNITQDVTITAQYEINQYTITFDSNGGSTVDAIIADFNTTINQPNNPVKEGYNFDGWYKDSGFTTPWNFESDQVPSEDITLYAKWQIKEYTVTFKDFDGTEVKSEIVLRGSTATAPTDLIREGYTFSGWDIDFNSVKNNLTVTAQYQKEPILKPIIKRTEKSDGTIVDSVEYTEEAARATIDQLKQEGKDTHQINIADEEDKVTETLIKIPTNTLKILKESAMNFEVFTDVARIILPKETTSSLNLGEELFFRIVPVREAPQQQEIKERAKSEKVIQDEIKEKEFDIIGKPAVIETNMESKSTDIILPIPTENLPNDPQERKQFLESLRVFIEHSDGEKVLVKGEIVEYKEDLLGIKFTINKFSTFTIISVEEEESSETTTENPKTGDKGMKWYILGVLIPGAYLVINRKKIKNN
ncbi:leucine-rich repeat protein [Serpentinicella sp. ANB-PHB4]|uniref:leucine-rich repeat protein n=1 Tax=Serpentinicella sp. ANB-PHB4 TaxID=3074076 RepID=UPI002856F176|nr:leucine-rich repeat protein [Serpentinicella sp. ANB-PHB4]MDR5658819.1 leucine-rich repeat protein [Serpentinicella sp. ANB-PHB4]